MEEVESEKTVGEYLAALRRHKFQIFAVTAVLAAVAGVVAIALPAVYRSTATILVQEQEIPPDLVRSTITSFADERIQVISQQVMTRAVLLQLVDKYGLYEKSRQRATNDEILERMRKDIKLTTVNADISDRSSGRRVNATIAFTISYDSPQPDRAQKIAQELASLYLDENLKAREHSVAETTAFLAQEADRLATQMKDIEGNLAQFKRRNAGRLPDSSGVNMQLAERSASELLRIQRDTSALQERQLALEAQLQAVPPNIPLPAKGVAGERGLTPAERLRALQAQYASASAVYGPEHPDIRRLKREIATLTAETSTSSKRAEATELEKPGAAADTSGKQASLDTVLRPDNPAYIALTSQIAGVKRELNQLAILKDDLRAQQRTYDARLVQIPDIEREYYELTRDYQNAQTRYREVKAKQMQAEVSQELEKDLKAERFSLGEPAHLPERPVSPNRPAIVLIGLIAALGGGLSLAALRDAFDASVKGPLELARIATVPILTAIPYIETRWEKLGKRRRTWMAVALLLFLTVAVLIGIHVFLKPLSLLLDSVTRRIMLL
jgi:polysaccharide biosynthesis transport protein